MNLFFLDSERRIFCSKKKIGLTISHKHKDGFPPMFNNGLTILREDGMLLS